jgi:hypothetical protein
MISILVVGAPGDREPEPPSDIEVLHARDEDEAVEKLGRNRRIDAVLVLDEKRLAETVTAIDEDVLAPPPIFAPATSGGVSGARRLAAPPGDVARLLRLLAEELEGSGSS